MADFEGPLTQQQAVLDQLGIGRLFWEIGDAVIVANAATGAIVLWNPAAERIFGYSAAEAQSLPLETLIPEPLRQRHQAGLACYAATGQGGLVGSHTAVELPALRKSGEPCVIELGLAPIGQSTDGDRLVLAVIRDVTARATAQTALRQSEARYRQLVELSPLPIALVCADELVYVNRAGADMLGAATPEALLGRPAQDFVHPEHRARVQQVLRRHAVDDTDAGETLEVQLVHTDGGVLDVELTATSALHAGEPAAQMMLRDITAWKQAEASLRHQALHDGLTELPNRSLLHDRLTQALTTAHADDPAALLLLDLDHFKDINDTLGHPAGDRLLQQVASRLQAAVRSTDTVARLGGDEFAIVLPRADATQASFTAARVLETLEAAVELEGHEVIITASIGIAVFPKHGRDVETLLRHADMALYAAKTARGRYTVYQPEQDQCTTDRLALGGALRRAISHDELTLFYQPKVACQSRALAGLEALVRWQHPELGLVPPDRFISLAEQTGLIRPLTRWVLDAALRQCHQWQQQGLSIPIAVNLSAHDVQDPELPQIVSAAVARWGIPPRWLTLEITESALVADPQGAMSVLSRVCAMGVQVALDDFGTGYSSLAYLRELPIHEVKVDRIFVRDMANAQKDLAIVQSTIELGHNLGLQVVAEGVEDQATLDLLSALGCDMAQGYELSRPMPAGEIAAWCRRTGCAPQALTRAA